MTAAETAVTSSAVSVDSYDTLVNSQKKQQSPLTIVNNITRDESIDLSFENVSFSIDMGFRKDKKTILHKINGTFYSGQLVGIVGPSGAGKTTLLELLCGYRTKNSKGQIIINKAARDLKTLKRSSCYIPCNNHLQPLLTVWENMQFAAELKLKPCFSEEKKNLVITNILGSLRLEACLDIRAAYLSGGQQKRLSIALELIKNPTIMFLDEPTTGLDSYSSSQCITLLQNLAKQGKTIICTIHQPSASLLQRFDQIYVLATGKCVYQGTPKNLVPFLDYVNYPCPKYYNPIDYIVELVSTVKDSKEITTLVEIIQNGKSLKWLEDPIFLSKSKDNCEQATFLTEEPVSTLTQFQILLKRALLKARRDWASTYLRFYVNLLTALLYGFLYWQMGSRGDRVRHNYSFINCVVIHHMMSSMMLTILSTHREISMLKKEHFNGWYSLKAYFAASSLADMPIPTLCCLLFTIITYVMTDQPMEFLRISMFTIISIMVVLVAQSFGFLMGSFFNFGNATFMGLSLTAPIMLLASYGENLEQHPIMSWLTYTSYMKYGFEGVICAVYGLDRLPLDCPDDKFCTYKYPDKFLKDILVIPKSLWLHVLGLSLYFIVFKISTYYVIRWRVKRTK